MAHKIGAQALQAINVSRHQAGMAHSRAVVAETAFRAANALYEHAVKEGLLSAGLAPDTQAALCFACGSVRTDVKPSEDGKLPPCPCESEPKQESQDAAGA